MKNNLKIMFYAICSITALSLFTACGGGSSDSKSGSISEFVGNWKSQCYSGQRLDDIAKEIGVSIVKALISN